MNMEWTKSRKMVTAPQNPFVKKLQVPHLRKLQVVLMSLTIAPLRVVCGLILFFFTWFLGVLFTFGLPNELEEPISPFRTFLFNVLQGLGRVNWKVLGFFLTVKGKRASAREAPIVVAAPHSALFDIILWFVTSPLPAGLSKKENLYLPCFGTLVKAIQPVLVVRENRSSTQVAIEEIRKRVKVPNKWPQLVVFPEGTRANAQSLILFKVGAFLCGSPIQPITIRYLNTWDTYTLTEYSAKPLVSFWLTMCQFWTSVEVTYLPVYNPSLEEISDSKLYANNVRSVMAESLNIKCTEHTYQDRLLMQQAEKLGFPKQHINIELLSVCRKFKLTHSQVKEWMQEFIRMSLPREDGLVSIQSYANHLGLPVTDALHDLFEIYDSTGSGSINFSQYVSGHSLLHATATADHTLDFSTQVYKEYISSPGSKSAIQLNHSDAVYFNMSQVAKEIEKRINKLGPNATVRDFFLERPEFSMLCIWYQLIVKKDCIANENICEIPSAENMSLRKRVKA